MICDSLSGYGRETAYTGIHCPWYIWNRASPSTLWQPCNMHNHLHWL